MTAAHRRRARRPQRRRCRRHAAWGTSGSNCRRRPIRPRGRGAAQMTMSTTALRRLARCPQRRRCRRHAAQGTGGSKQSHRPIDAAARPRRCVDDDDDVGATPVRCAGIERFEAKPPLALLFGESAASAACSRADASERRGARRGGGSSSSSSSSRAPPRGAARSSAPSSSASSAARSAVRTSLASRGAPPLPSARRGDGAPLLAPARRGDCAPLLAPADRGDGAALPVGGALWRRLERAARGARGDARGRADDHARVRVAHGGVERRRSGRGGSRLPDRREVALASVKSSPPPLPPSSGS